jgi:hypothetical protein
MGWGGAHQNGMAAGNPNPQMGAMTGVLGTAGPPIPFQSQPAPGVMQPMSQPTGYPTAQPMLGHGAWPAPQQGGGMQSPFMQNLAQQMGQVGSRGVMPDQNQVHTQGQNQNGRANYMVRALMGGQ